MFTITGWLIEPNSPQNQVAITWDDGILSGPDAVVNLALRHARALDGLPVGPPDGPTTDRDHLRSPISAVMLLSDLFLPDSVQLAGDVPKRAALPRGTVG